VTYSLQLKRLEGKVFDIDPGALFIVENSFIATGSILGKRKDVLISYILVLFTDEKNFYRTSHFFKGHTEKSTQGASNRQVLFYFC
jgi:hypothetical protein